MKRFVFALTFAVFAVAGVGMAQDDEMLRQVKAQTSILFEGDKAADFTGKRIDGTSVSLSDYSGKVVLLTFWGSWCGPCRQELHTDNLPATIAEFADNNDFVFLPIANKDTRESLIAFFDSPNGKAAYSYLRPITLVDTNRDIFNLYAKSGVPRTVVVGRDGKIVYVGLGATESGLKAIAAAIRGELAKQTR